MVRFSSSSWSLYLHMYRSGERLGRLPRIYQPSASKYPNALANTNFEVVEMSAIVNLNATMLWSTSFSDYSFLITNQNTATPDSQCTKPSLTNSCSSRPSLPIIHDHFHEVDVQLSIRSFRCLVLQLDLLSFSHPASSLYLPSRPPGCPLHADSH